jgi:hypothetical protein
MWHGAYGPQQGAVTRTSGGKIVYVNKGVKKAMQASKREEAEERNARTKPENRRRARLGLQVLGEMAAQDSKRKRTRKR